MAGETTITVIGNLTNDPELRFTPSGSAVANFTIASTPRTFDRQSNEWKDGETLFLRAAVWREAAENVAESLTNAAKHSRASVVTVNVGFETTHVRVFITDDGVGGATSHKGSGLIGLIDRVEALGGTLEVSSLDGEGTTLHTVLPLQAPAVNSTVLLHSRDSGQATPR